MNEDGPFNLEEGIAIVWDERRRRIKEYGSSIKPGTLIKIKKKLMSGFQIEGESYERAVLDCPLALFLGNAYSLDVNPGPRLKFLINKTIYLWPTTYIAYAPMEVGDLDNLFEVVSEP